MASTRNENPLPLLGRVRKSENKNISSCKTRNIYENVQIAMEQDNNKVVLSSAECGDNQGNNCSCLSVMSPFDEKAEWAEIADIMASFGGSIARESVFAQDVESHFAQAFKSGKNISRKALYYELSMFYRKIVLISKIFYRLILKKEKNLTSHF